MIAQHAADVWLYVMLATAFLAALGACIGHRNDKLVMLAGGALAGQMTLVLALGWAYGTVPNALASLAPTLFH